MDAQTIVHALFEIIDKLNEQRDQNEQIPKTENTILIGEGSDLDSLALINFIVSVEQKLEEEFQTLIVLTEQEDFFTSQDGPFKTIGTLAFYIAKEIGREA
jgi:acyl carrier protein